MTEGKKRAKNGSVPRYCDPGYKSSYQKVREELAALRARLDSAVAAGYAQGVEATEAKAVRRIDELTARLALAEKVVAVVVRFRDAWREDHSHIPPLEQTRDYAPLLIELWNKISDYERAPDAVK